MITSKLTCGTHGTNFDITQLPGHVEKLVLPQTEHSETHFQQGKHLVLLHDCLYHIFQADAPEEEFGTVAINLA
jgi:hypothetical protein